MTECAFSANTINDTIELKKDHNENNNTLTQEPTTDHNMSVQNSLKRAISEEENLIFISRHVNRVKATLSKSSSFNKPNYVREMATNLEHIQGYRDYTDEINRTLPKLHDQFYPPSNKELTFIEEDLVSLKGRVDYSPFGLERGLELERIQSSMFYNQLSINNMAIGWNTVYKFLQQHWDALGIPYIYINGNKLMIIEMEFISLLMCDVLPKKYKEQGIWINEPSQGRHYKFFSKLDIHQA